MDETPQPVITLTFTEPNEAIAAIKAQAMLGAIKTYYGDCIRRYVKHVEMSDEAAKIVDEISERLREHFEDFDGMVY